MLGLAATVTWMWGHDGCPRRSATAFVTVLPRQRCARPEVSSGFGYRCLETSARIVAAVIPVVSSSSRAV
ncbi:hypothetical protein CP970_43695 [Streptomyces kanamyceticus]|uniref:Uncharacterized protein n=1 Tax=Streptomyces kanamyceticus TaxID=1967 RepID=A0A5J6GV89_STRKN|nr:hypothetical protein CP970_43695 [Streptomyces kanamyceticus]